MISFRQVLLLVLTVYAAAECACMQVTTERTPDRILFSDDFSDLSNWTTELERSGAVYARGGLLTIDVPAGCCVWFKSELTGPLRIQYEARLVQEGGPNDQVSDLNCFWMATDSRGPDFLAVPRTGRFADYNQLRTYYVGQGGNRNTTTRFRRYVGDQSNRPLLPEHDLTAPLLKPNTWMTLQLVACGHLVEYYCDRKRVFQYHDPEPYTHGRFAFRTTQNHMEVRRFRVERMTPATAGEGPARADGSGS